VAHWRAGIFLREENIQNESYPTKASLIALRSTTKILMGDWIWHPNRPLNLPQSVWHNNKGHRRLNMVYGDGHVDISTLPDTLNINQPVDMNFIWW